MICVQFVETLACENNQKQNKLGNVFYLDMYLGLTPVRSLPPNSSVGASGRLVCFYNKHALAYYTATKNLSGHLCSLLPPSFE